MRRRVLILLFVFAGACGGPEPPPVPGPTAADVAYDSKHARNVLDFWRAESDRPTALVVWFHGGGFAGGDKSSLTRRNPELLNALLMNGISVASCNYPFRQDAPYEEIMRHCGRAIQFLRSKEEEWNLDPDRFGVCGASAGALIAEWIGYHPDLARAESNDPIDRLSSSVSVVGSHYQPTETRRVMQFMKSGGPPLFLWSAAPESDRIHNPKFARMIKDCADRLKIPCELWGRNNGLPEIPDGQTWLTLQLTFFARYLESPAGEKG